MSPTLEIQLLQAFEAMRDKFEHQAREASELRIRVERIIADNEAREAICRITHDAVNARLKRHSDGFALVRGEQDSIHEEIEETTKTGLAPAKEHPQVTVARWTAISAIGVALVAGGFVAALAKIIVAALAHAMGIGG